MDLAENGKLLYGLRKAKGMTQKQVADRLGIQPKKKTDDYQDTFCIKITVRFWCGRQELNLHGGTHKILSLARLPVPPRPH